MIKEEGWLELVEIIRTNENGPLLPISISREDTALQIFHQQNDQGNDPSPLASVVLQASICPAEMFQKNKSNGNVQYDNILMRLHPVLFFFLYQASLTNSTGSSGLETEVGKDQEVIASSPTTSNQNATFPVELGPLPMLEFQSIRDMVAHEQRKHGRESAWKCRPVKIGKLQRGSEIFLSCVYIEAETMDDSISFDQAVGISLEGRIVQTGSVVLLSTLHGYVIATIANIIDSTTKSDDNQRKEKAYRLSDDVLSDYECHIETPTLQENNREALNEDTEASMWERDIPGYETSLQQIMTIFGHHGDTAGASGIVLTGCAGVGKSRLASCVAGQFSQSLITKKQQSSRHQKIYFSSVQDLIFQASIETNLLENVLVPKLKGCVLWVIDDLNLLESDEGNNAEIIMVRNALIEAMDRFHLRCCILGIAHSDGNLPLVLTKSGRLEKTVQVLPPTQLQRIKIWKYILAHDAASRPLLDNTSGNDDWVVTLASSTAGCVPSDLLRIYRYALQRLHANKARGMEVPSTLSWEDLREAIKSTTPSQLSELDVIRPTIFSEGLSWKEIHLRSWQNFGGYQVLKQSVYRQVVVPWRHFLQNLDKLQSDQMVKKEKSWLEPPPGVLFHGMSGTGKTVAAKCLAVSLGLPIIQVRATDLLDKWLGGSESLLRSLFTRARTVSPCILFLDEIDAIACNREEDDNNDVSSRILSTLLNEMDGVSSAIKTSRLLVLACTNRIQSIDSALLRPGRLQEHFHMGHPDVPDLEEILKLRMDKIPMDQDLLLSDLASTLFENEATGADVEGLCREATFVAMRRLQLDRDMNVAVSKDDFECAISERFGAPEDESKR